MNIVASHAVGAIHGGSRQNDLTRVCRRTARNISPINIPEPLRAQSWIAKSATTSPPTFTAKRIIANHHAHRRPRRSPMPAASVPKPSAYKSRLAARPSVSNAARAGGFKVKIHSVNRVGRSKALATAHAMKVAMNKKPATIETDSGRFIIIYCSYAAGIETHVPVQP
jgi:hypothetical protein